MERIAFLVVPLRELLLLRPLQAPQISQPDALVHR
jgi:hypothetical protein